MELVVEQGDRKDLKNLAGESKVMRRGAEQLKQAGVERHKLNHDANVVPSLKDAVGLVMRRLGDSARNSVVVVGVVESKMAGLRAL